MRPKVYQRAVQLSLPHIKITKTEKNLTKTEKTELKHKTDEQISPVKCLDTHAIVWLRVDHLAYRTIQLVVAEQFDHPNPRRSATSTPPHFPIAISNKNNQL